MSTKPVRLGLALGPWQVVMLSICLRAHLQRSGRPMANRLVLFGARNMDAGARSTMERIAGATGLWEDVRWDNGLLKLQPPPDEWPFDFARHAGRLREALGAPAADELWLCHLLHIEHYFIMEAFPHASIMLYEDGLQAATPTVLAPRRAWARDWRILPGLLMRGRVRAHYRSLRLCAHHPSPCHARRVRMRYLYATAGFPPPPPFERTRAAEVDDDTARRMIRGLGTALPEASAGWPVRDPADAKVLLFLAAPFSAQGYMEAATERAVYRDLLDRLMAEGWVVWWKDHPRDRAPVINDLRERYPANRLKRLSDVSTLPVELLQGVGAITACAGPNSSSLFYLRRLYGLPTYTCAGRFVGLGSPLVEPGLELCRRNLPDVDELWASSAAPGGAAHR